MDRWVLDWRLMTMTDAKELSLSDIDYWLDRIRRRNGASPKVKIKLGAR